MLGNFDRQPRRWSPLTTNDHGDVTLRDTHAPSEFLLRDASVFEKGFEIAVSAFHGCDYTHFR